MPRTTVLDGSDFTGKTRSFTVLPGGGSWPTFRHCGSTIYPQRFESPKVRSMDWALADAERLRAAGWLEARTVNDTDDVAFFWTREAETALDMNALNQSVGGRQN